MKLLVNFFLIFLVQFELYGEDDRPTCEVPENFLGIVQLHISKDKVPSKAKFLTGIKPGCEGCFQSAMQDQIILSNDELSVPILVDTRVRRMDYSATYRLSFTDKKGEQFQGMEDRVVFKLKRWIEIEKKSIEVIESKKGIDKKFEFRGTLLSPGDGVLKVDIANSEGLVTRPEIIKNENGIVLILNIQPADVGMYSIEASISRREERHIENWMLSVTDAVFSSSYVGLGACIQGNPSTASLILQSGVTITNINCDNDKINLDGWKQEGEKIVIQFIPLSEGVLKGWLNVYSKNQQSRIPFTFMSVRK